MLNNWLIINFSDEAMPRFILSLHKIGCTSAIKASFIAFGLHYLCTR